MDIVRSKPIGVSSNGRTRDFGSLYHGSNPCAPTTLRICDASGGRPPKQSSKGEGVSHEVLTKCGKVEIRMFYVYLIKSISHPEQKFNRHLPVLFLVAHESVRAPTAHVVSYMFLLKNRMFLCYASIYRSIEEKVNK